MPSSFEQLQSDFGSETDSPHRGRDVEDHVGGKTHKEKGRQKESSSERRKNSPRRITKDEKARKDRYVRVQVLLLTFEYTDLEDIRTETTTVYNTFNALGYDVNPCFMGNRNPKADLDRELDQALKKADSRTLLIIYYHGHGDFDPKDKSKRLYFSSHHPPEDDFLHRSTNDVAKPEKLNQIVEHEDAPKATIFWERIRNKLKGVKSDTLIILDCCNAGLAAVDLQNVDSKPQEQGQPTDPGERRRQPRKELIGACVWDNTTQDRMSPAMCDELDELQETGDCISASHLASRMNNRLIRLCKTRKDLEKTPQAVHYVLRYSEHEKHSRSGEPMAGKIVLPWLKKKGLGGKSPPKKKLGSEDDSASEKKMASRPKKGAKPRRKKSQGRGPSSKNVQDARNDHSEDGEPDQSSHSSEAESS